jgi:ketosteroid isomerase-like protein
MSERNVEAVRRGYEAFARGDIAAAMDLFHPDVEWHDPDRPGGGTYRGHEGVLRNMAEWLEGWEEFRLEPEEFLAAGDQVVVLVRQSGRGKGSGVEIEGPLAQVFRLREGKVVWARIYASREEALKSVGLQSEGRTSPV